MSGKKGSKHGNSIERFLKIVKEIEPVSSGCKPWPLGKDKDGYGYYTIKGKMYIAHRLLYEALYPGDYQKLAIMHSCDVRACCNINHLSAGTFSENTLDMVKKKRNVKGCKVGTAKLTEEQICEIKRLFVNCKIMDLCEEFKVCKQTIYNIINGSTYV